MSYAERLRYLNLHSLTGRRIRGDLIQTFKLHHGYEDLHWDDFFQTPPYDRTRKCEGKIFIKHCHTNVRKFSFSNRVANYWNDLPLTLRNAPTINSFKNQLDMMSKFKDLFLGYD